MNAAVSVKDEASSLADNDDANDDDAANDDDGGGIPRPNVFADNDKTARSRPLSFFSTSNKTQNGRDGNDVLSSSSASAIDRIIRIIRRLQATRHSLAGGVRVNGDTSLDGWRCTVCWIRQQARARLWGIPVGTRTY